MLLHELLKDKKVVLASKSPRRQELLKGLDIPFEVRTQDVPEEYSDDLQPFEVAEFLAELKAKAFDIGENEIIITSDTIVVLDGHIIEKPADREHAISMVKRLSGKQHKVITAVSIRDQHRAVTFHDICAVTFKELSDEEVEWYIDKYQPYDKAGSYGVQEWIGYVAVTRMEGSYFTVMGFPVHRVYDALHDFATPVAQ